MKHLTLLTTLLLAPLVALPAATPAKPNILHIHADDHRPDGLRALGNPLLITPNLDSLAERGMTFTRCYTMGSMSGAVCAPSRAMLLTGRSWLRIPREHAAAANASDPSTFLPRVMAAAGYQTWHMGKAGEVNAFGIGLKHFETTIADEGKGGERAGNSRRLADKTIEFLKSRDAGGEKRPFYAYLAPPVPHDPRIAEPQFHKLYDPAKIPLSPAFLPQHPFDNGEMTVRDEKLAPWPRTPENTRQQLADYYACITGFDHHIGRIFEQLKKSGQWDNTIIIFSGDNGLSMGEHGLFGKQNLYEFGGMHVPLVIAGPGIPKGNSEAFVYLMDLFPTFAEFAGAKIPDGVEGKSIAPILNGTQTKVRDVLYTAYRDCQRAIRDDRWKLIRYPLVDRTQLFDLSSDPRELVNLADKPEHAAKIADLTALLTKEMASHADTAPLTVAKPKPAEWSPPAPGDKPERPGKKKPAATVAPAPAAVGQPTGRIRVDSKPNVLLLFADQHNADMMGCSGHPIVKTPHLDQLAAQGVRFTRAYCQDAICVPSRTSLMTGLYPRTTGCLDNGDAPVSQTKLYPLQQVFQSAGYLTGCFGKRHLPRPTLALGWNRSATVIAPNQDPSDENYQDWIQTRGPGQAEAFEKDHKGSLQSDMGCHLSEVKPENRIEAYTALMTKDFLRDCQKQGKNFFCWASFHGPHQPYTPPPKWAALYPVENMPLPASVNEPIDHLPPGLQNWRRNTKTPWSLAKAAENPALYQKYIAYYFAQVTEVDHYIGDVLAELAALGLRDNTIVIYASDHGDFVARHGMIEKCAVSHNVYEETLRVPLIVSWPTRFQQGATCNSLAELVDLYPTLVELLGLQRPADAPKLAGRSLVPTLAEGKPTGRAYAVSENWSQTTIITDRYKLGTWIDPTARYAQRDFRQKFPDLLFDRQNDPQELANLAGKPDYAAVEMQLRAHLAEWTGRTADDGKKALSASPAETKSKKQKSNQ